jgi:peroxiredoxin
MTVPPSSGLGSRAPDFALPDLHGDTVRLADVRGERGTVIMFICNHCPYVRSVIGRIAEDSRALLDEGVGVAAIMSNDHRAYPDDAPDKMRAFAAEHGLPFPYLLDESQKVARAFDAVCTPDFFGYDSDLVLR